MDNKKFVIKEIKSLKFFNGETGEEIKPEEFKPTEDDGVIEGDLKYSRDKIYEMVGKLDYEKVSMAGFYSDLEKLKAEMERFYDKHVFYLGYSLSDAPYHGWSGDELKEMRQINKEICDKVKEMYAVILKGLGY